MLVNIGIEADPRLCGRLIDVIDAEWINSELPLEDILVPLDELPDSEQESRPKETVKDMEKKWNDTCMQNLLDRIEHRE